MEDTTNTKLPFKYIIISVGCSYSIHLEQTQRIVKKNNLTKHNFLENCEVIHLGAPSSSIQHTKETIIQITKWLLNNGILNEDIFIISNLTQFGRMYFKVDESLTEETTNVLDSKQFNSNPNFVFDFYGFKTIIYPAGYFYLNDTLYSSLVDSPSQLKKLPNPVYNSILNYFDEYYKIDTIDHMVEYITNVISIQEFLKENKIDHRFYFMNDIFEGWTLDDEIVKHVYSENVGKFEIPDLTKYGDITNLDSRIKDVFSLIDFDNIISYKTKKFNYGGLDEYTITKFSFTDYISTTHFKNENDYKDFNFIGQHPVSKVTRSFEEEFILPELQPFLNKLV